MKRTALPALVLALALGLSGCGDDGDDTGDATGNGPTAATTPTLSASATPCTPAGTGTTDMATKPVPVIPKTPAPAETTVTDVVCGTGEEAKDGSDVEVKYVGVLYADGKEFDSSWSRGPAETLPFRIGGGVITGFSKGVTGMKVGGRRQVVIPPAEGYGDQANGQIPAGSTLVFVIDLVTVG